MHTRPIEKDLLWLARQRPHNKRQNRILLLNAKKRISHETGRTDDKTDDTNSIPQSWGVINAV